MLGVSPHKYLLFQINEMWSFFFFNLLSNFEGFHKTDFCTQGLVSKPKKIPSNCNFYLKVKHGNLRLHSFFCDKLWLKLGGYTFFKSKSKYKYLWFIKMDLKAKKLRHFKVGSVMKMFSTIFKAVYKTQKYCHEIL